MDSYQLIKDCYDFAVENSDDLSNQNAAMLLAENGEYFFFANQIPVGITKSDERIKIRPTKYDFIEHAERGAIYGASKNCIRTNGATLFCPWIACADCSRAIVLSGIKKVVTHKQRCLLTSHGRKNIVDVVSDRWVNLISNGDAILREANIEVVYLDFIAGKKILINEQLMDV